MRNRKRTSPTRITFGRSLLSVTKIAETVGFLEDGPTTLGCVSSRSIDFLGDTLPVDIGDGGVLDKGDAEEHIFVISGLCFFVGHGCAGIVSWWRTVLKKIDLRCLKEFERFVLCSWRVSMTMLVLRSMFEEGEIREHEKKRNTNQQAAAEKKNSLLRSSVRDSKDGELPQDSSR
jgi:hypothetical protein